MPKPPGQIGVGDCGRSRVPTGERDKRAAEGCIRKSRTGAADPQEASALSIPSPKGHRLDEPYRQTKRGRLLRNAVSVSLPPAPPRTYGPDPQLSFTALRLIAALHEDAVLRPRPSTEGCPPGIGHFSASPFDMRPTGAMGYPCGHHTLTAAPPAGLVGEHCHSSRGCRRCRAASYSRRLATGYHPRGQKSAAHA